MSGCAVEEVSAAAAHISRSLSNHSGRPIRYNTVPADLPITVISTLKPYISIVDISLMSQAVSVVALLLDLSPKNTYPEVERDLLPDIYTIAHSPLVAGAAFESVLSFFAALVQADMEVATHLVPNLVISVDKAQKADASLANVARCIGQVVIAQQSIAAGTIAEFAKHLKVCRQATLLLGMSHTECVC